MKKRILKIATVLLLSTLAGPLYARGFHDGVSAYEKGDLKGALQAWRPAAEQGDMLAQFNLGALYEHGRGVKKDLAEAAKWYRKAAEQGNALAQYYLGNLYANGEGVEKNLPEATAWYRKAAAQGVPQAQEALSKLSK
ncbi:MAG: tetratricopeptide repeat protein [Gammaproteobacteria bacterium]|nr:tetratricopeptide repeat protein [Gammaproteobacteria bacterium]